MAAKVKANRRQQKKRRAVKETGMLWGSKDGICRFCLIAPRRITGCPGCAGSLAGKKGNIFLHHTGRWFSAARRINKKKGRLSAAQTQPSTGHWGLDIFHQLNEYVKFRSIDVPHNYKTQTRNQILLKLFEHIHFPPIFALLK
jgi:hypothetical protein